MKIYLVHGYSGQYSDRYEWVYKAFYTYDKAKACADELQQICDEAQKRFGKMYEIDNVIEYRAEEQAAKEFTEKYTFNPEYSDDAFFSVKEVELVD